MNAAFGVLAVATVAQHIHGGVKTYHAVTCEIVMTFIWCSFAGARLCVHTYDQIVLKLDGRACLVTEFAQKRSYLVKDDTVIVWVVGFGRPVVQPS